VGLEPTAHRLCPAVFTVFSEKKPSAKRAEASQKSSECLCRAPAPVAATAQVPKLKHLALEQSRQIYDV